MSQAVAGSFVIHATLILAALLGVLWRPLAAPPPDTIPHIAMILQPALTGDRDMAELVASAARPQPPSIAPIAAMLSAAPAIAPVPIRPAVPVPEPPALDQAIGTAVAAGAGIIPATPDSRRNSPPRYPESSRRHGEEGRVLLLIHVAADGHVQAVDLEHPSGYANLDRAARDAAQHWHFHPALAGKTPVESTFETEVVFQFADRT